MALKLLNKIQISKNLKQYICSKALNRATTAGIIVIGDEILKGEVADTNSTFLAAEFHQLGVQLKKISVVGDIVNEVAEEVQHFSKSYDYVITSGGIGPTHDDITYEAVAVAFEEKLVLHPELKDICAKFYNTSNVNCPGMKLAYVPESARLNFIGVKGQKMIYPNVSVNNVYMFPGIPELLIKSFNNLKEILFKSNKKFYSKMVYFNITEDKIAEVLQVLVEEYPEVQFGSYPKLLHSVYKVKVTIESCKEESTIQAYKKLLTLIPKRYIVDDGDI
ncbi:FAD synthase-like isoform X2 [Anoplophora glabripennis]|uniref:FAD synthase-like isoform X2 n=1 Tax=Anoplophora glabripennis TaxID=217634 RepID=UPI0008753633|nr:FAD synthase-like isoform X2 [Anoplophora glabripennis]